MLRLALFTVGLCLLLFLFIPLVCEEDIKAKKQQESLLENQGTTRRQARQQMQQLENRHRGKPIEQWPWHDRYLYRLAEKNLQEGL